MPWSCPWSRDCSRGPVISGPLHLLLQKEAAGQQHVFRSKSLRKPRPCHWCHQPVVRQASCCRVCKYICHTTCENKISDHGEVNKPSNPTSLVIQSKTPDAARFTDTSWQIHRTWGRDGAALPGTPPTQTPPRALAAPAPNSAPPIRNHTPVYTIYDSITPRAVSAPPTPAGVLTRNHVANGGRSISFTAGGGAGAGGAGGAGGGRLDLCYVAERMLALHLPERDGHAEAQANHMLATKHGEHFMIFEVTEAEEGGAGGVGARSVLRRVRSLGWPGELAPPLERLCAACKHIDRWLAHHPKNVAVLLAWGSVERLGVLVAAYMHYSAICGAAEHALDRYAMRRYLLDRVPTFALPSNKRYIETFAGLLAGQIRVNSAPLVLTHVSVAGAIASPRTPAVAFLKVYENHTCVYTSGLYMVSGGGWTVGVGRLSLRGDILVRAYRRPASPATQAAASRRLVFACQFHTCAVADHTLSFTKQQLDYAAHDPEFPSDGAVELVFARCEGGGGAPPAPTPAAPLRAAPDPAATRDSLEHLAAAAARPLSDLTDDDPPDSSGSGSGGVCAETGSAGCAEGGNDGEAGSGSGSGEAAHTFGPLDGSIYATVVRGPPSPLSASMDSGISSAGRRAAPSPPDELDALLGDMLRTVSALPDAPAAPPAQSRAARQTDIPYHARADSAPFTYGAPGLQPGMLRASNRLASPELVRRALNPSYRPIEDDDDAGSTTPEPTLAPTLTRKKLTHEDLKATSTPSTPYNNRWQNGSLEWTDKSLTNGRKPLDGTWRSDCSWQERSRSREPRRSESSVDSGAGSGLTWLQRQQQKLRERREAQARVTRLPLEWGTAPSRHIRRSASHRVDGYTSDTTAFADDDDDFSIPLHIQTSSHRNPLRTDSISPQAPDRTSSRKYMMAEKITREWSATSSASPGLLSLADSVHSDTLRRERERLGSWSRSEGRAGTPSFPTHPRTPYPPTPTPTPSHYSHALPPRSPLAARRAHEGSPESEYRTLNGSLSGTSRRSSLGGTEPRDPSPDRVRFARDTSHYWYKPNISRDEAISILQRSEEGAFLVRDSNSFPGAFGLAVRAGAGVRHFLVEPTARGVRLRGCPDEPVFSSLSALVYQHTVTALALPCLLRLPDRDPGGATGAGAAARALLASGAACHVLLLGSDNTEALTGPEAVRRATNNVLAKKGGAHVVHFKVFAGGITLTDSARRLFFRRHYPAASVSHAGLDPDDRRYTYLENGAPTPKRIFAFVARASLAATADNQCHVFAELEPEQPATAIVNFVNKALLGNTQKRDII